MSTARSRKSLDVASKKVTQSPRRKTIDGAIIKELELAEESNDENSVNDSLKSGKRRWSSRSPLNNSASKDGKLDFSLSSVKSANGKRENRRLTAEPADMSALLGMLSDSTASSKLADQSGISENTDSAPVSYPTRLKPNITTVSNNQQRRKTFDGGIQELNTMLDTSEYSEGVEEKMAPVRRATVDPSDMAALIKEFEDDQDGGSLQLSVSTRSTCRLSRSSIANSESSCSVNENEFNDSSLSFTSSIKSPNAKSPCAKKVKQSPVSSSKPTKTISDNFIKHHVDDDRPATNTPQINKYATRSTSAGSKSNQASSEKGKMIVGLPLAQLSPPLSISARTKTTPVAEQVALRRSPRFSNVEGSVTPISQHSYKLSAQRRSRMNNTNSDGGKNNRRLTVGEEELQVLLDDLDNESAISKNSASFDSTVTDGLVTNSAKTGASEDVYAADEISGNALDKSEVSGASNLSTSNNTINITDLLRNVSQVLGSSSPDSSIALGEDEIEQDIAKNEERSGAIVVLDEEKAGDKVILTDNAQIVASSINGDENVTALVTIKKKQSKASLCGADSNSNILSSPATTTGRQSFGPSSESCLSLTSDCSACSDKNILSKRRETVDPSDLAALMGDLVDSEQKHGVAGTACGNDRDCTSYNLNSSNLGDASSINVSRLSTSPSAQSTIGGRDSIDTAVLLTNVDLTIKQLEKGPIADEKSSKKSIPSPHENMQLEYNGEEIVVNTFSNTGNATPATAINCEEVDTAIPLAVVPHSPNEILIQSDSQHASHATMRKQRAQKNETKLHCYRQQQQDEDNGEDVDNVTINGSDADELLNDSISTNASIATVATIDLLETVQAALENEHNINRIDDDDDDDVTSGSLAPLADVLTRCTAELEAQHHSNEIATSSATIVTKEVEPASEYTSPSPSLADKLRCESESDYLSNECSNTNRLPSASSSSTSPTCKSRANGVISRSEEKKPGTTKTRPQLRRASVGAVISTATGNGTEYCNGSISDNETDDMATDGRCSSNPTSPSGSSANSNNSLNTATVCAENRWADQVDMPPPTSVPSALKSCLSSRKVVYHATNAVSDDASLEVASSARKSVIFGSPQAAEFNKTSPTTNFTPLDKGQAKTLFSMNASAPTYDSGDDEVTRENERILQDWDRLTVAGESDSDDRKCASTEDVSENATVSTSSTIVEAALMSPSPRRAKGSKSKQKAPQLTTSSAKRRQSMLQPVLSIELDSASECAEKSVGTLNTVDSSVLRVNALTAASGESPEDGSGATAVDETSMSMSEDITNTVSLPDDLAALIAQNNYSGLDDSYAGDSALVSKPAHLVSEERFTKSEQTDESILRKSVATAHIENRNSDVSLSLNSSSQKSISVDHTEEIEVDLHSLMRNVNKSRLSFNPAMVPSSVTQHLCDADNSGYISNSDHSRMSTSTDGKSVGPCCTSSHDSSTSGSNIMSMLEEVKCNSSNDGDELSMVMADKVYNSNGDAKRDGAIVTNIGRAQSANELHAKTESSSFDEGNTEGITQQLEGSLADLVSTLDPKEGGYIATTTRTFFDKSITSAPCVAHISHSNQPNVSYASSESIKSVTSHLEASSDKVMSVEIDKDISMINGSVLNGEGNDVVEDDNDIHYDVSVIESIPDALINKSQLTTSSAGVSPNSCSATPLGSNSTPGTGKSVLSTRRSTTNTTGITAAAIVSESSDYSFADSTLHSLVDGDKSYNANTSSHIIVDHDATNVSTSGIGLMERVRALNADARSNALLQCQTPAAGKSRLSVGMKRMTMTNNTHLLKSAQKAAKKLKQLDSSVLSINNDPSHTSEKAPLPPHRTNLVGLSTNPLLARISRKNINMRTTAVKTDSNAVSTSNTIDYCSEQDQRNDDKSGNTDEDDSSDESTLLTAAERNVSNVLRHTLFKYFSAIQSVKTILQPFRADVRSLVRKKIRDSIHTAYLDSVLGQLPMNALNKAWDLEVSESSSFIASIVEDYSSNLAVQAFAITSISGKCENSGSEDDSSSAEQMCINIGTVNTIAHTASLVDSRHSSHATVTPTTITDEVDNVAPVADRFFNKVLGEPSKLFELGANYPALGAIKRIDSVSTPDTLHALQNQLQTTELSIDVLNKFTFCRVISFQSDCIHIVAVLSPTVHASMVFHIQQEHTEKGSLSANEADTIVHTLSDTEIDLVVTAAPKQSNQHQNVQDGAETITNMENQFVSAYFAGVLCSHEGNGPLSEASLLAIEHPSQIPGLLQQVSGYISSLRVALRVLPKLHNGGWSFCVTKATTDSGSLFASATATTASSKNSEMLLNITVDGDECNVLLPMYALISYFQHKIPDLLVARTAVTSNSTELTEWDKDRVLQSLIERLA